jgi:hypothetical protein
MPKVHKIRQPKASRRPAKATRRASIHLADATTLDDKLLAKSSGWTFLLESGVEVVKPSRDFMEIDDVVLPNFSPKKFSEALKKVGYPGVKNPVYIEYGTGKPKGLCVFNLEGYMERMWLSKTVFVGAFDKKRDYAQQFKTAARLYESESKTKRANQDGDESEDEDEDGDEEADGNEEEEGDEEEGVVAKVEYKSDAVLEDDDPADDDRVVIETVEDEGNNDDSDAEVERPKTSLTRLKKKTTLPSTGKFEYANKVLDILWGLEKNDNVYNLRKLKTAPSKIIHTDRTHKGYGPLADAEFITKLTAMETLKNYKILGCAGFPYSKGSTPDEECPPVWKVAVLELTEEDDRKALLEHRSALGCNYKGPVLLSWSVFRNAVKKDVDKAALKKARELFALTDFAQEMQDRGIDLRKVRHVTIADDLRVVHERLRKMEEGINSILETLKRSKL